MSSRVDALSANTASWETIYAENFANLCARACRLLTNGNSFEAEDTVSEAFFRVIRYAPDPKCIQDVIPYLWTVVKRVWTTEQMRPATALTDRLEDLKPEEIERLPGARVEPQVMATLGRQDFLVELKLKLGPTSVEECTMLQLRLDGHSLEEIASVLEEDVKQTRFRWSRFVARQRYRLTKEKARAKGAC